MRKEKSKGNEKGHGKRLPLFFCSSLEFPKHKRTENLATQERKKAKRGCKGTQRPPFLPRAKTIHPPLFSRPLTSLFLVLLCIHCHVCKKIFGFEHPHPLLVEILWGWALQQHSGAGLSRETLGLGFRRLWVWALGLDLWGWASRNSGVGDSGLGTPGNGGVGRPRETLGLGWGCLGLGTPGPL